MLDRNKHLLQVLQLCFKQSRKERPTAEKLLEHKFFKCDSNEDDSDYSCDLSENSKSSSKSEEKDDRQSNRKQEDKQFPKIVIVWKDSQ